MGDPWIDNPIIPQKKRARNEWKHNLVWLLPLFALAYFDYSSVPVLAVPLVILASIVLFISKYLVKLVPVLGDVNILSYVLSPILTVAIIYYGVTKLDTESILNSISTNPLPNSVQLVKSGGQVRAFGSSSFYAFFYVDSSGFDELIDGSELESRDINALNGHSPTIYKEIVNESSKWLDNPSIIYIYDEPNSGYRCRILISNEAKNKVFYRIY